MGTPHKPTDQYLESPYANHLAQYPSQSEGFVPNEFGGKSWGPSSTPSKQQHQCNNYQPYTNQRRRGNNRYFNNRGGGNGGNNFAGGYRNNYQNNFQDNYNQQQTNRHSNSGNRQQQYHGQRYNKSDGNSRNDYYHPTMLDDPWKELVERHNAIRNSQISDPIATTTTEDEESHDPHSGQTQKNAIKTAIPTMTPATSTGICP